MLPYCQSYLGLLVEELESDALRSKGALGPLHFQGVSFPLCFYLRDCIIVSHSGAIALLIFVYLIYAPKDLSLGISAYLIFISLITPKHKDMCKFPRKMAQTNSSIDAQMNRFQNQVDKFTL